MNGLINLYKPSGMSSAQAVARVRRILGVKTAGHMGTLDPMAEGVLVIGVGKSARLFDYLLKKRKAYIAKFKFGYETDTLDALGVVTAETRDIPSSDAVLGAMQSMIGRIEQIPPDYSAKHVDGERAYKLARAGKPQTPKAVPVEIYGVELICQPRPDETVFYIECSAGTYIRSLCRDAAKLCGSLATLTYLQRVKSGRFDVKDSITLEALEIQRDAAVVPPDAALDLERCDVPDEFYDDMIHGRKIPFSALDDVFVYCRGELFGIGAEEDGHLKLKTYLKDEKI